MEALAREAGSVVATPGAGEIFEAVFGATEPAIGVTPAEAAGETGESVTPCGLESSFRHICETPRPKYWLRSRVSTGERAATQVHEDSTGLSGSKGEWGMANVGCFVKVYTTNGGFTAANPTRNSDTDFVSLLPRSSHQATIMPANSRVNSLKDLRFSHHWWGSKSPSRALT